MQYDNGNCSVIMGPRNENRVQSNVNRGRGI